MTQTFAREFTPRQAWTGKTLVPRDWLVHVPPTCVAELDAALAQYRKGSPPLETVSPAAFELPHSRALMDRAREELTRGCGLVVLDRFPVEQYTPDENRVIGWLLASLLGPVVEQKWGGTRVYDVKDSGQPLGYGVRRSITNLEQPFHTDGGWLTRPPAFVGLFCLDSAQDGGMSRFVSLVTAHELLLELHPDLLERLYQPFWWDRQAEHPPHDARMSAHPVFERRGGFTARYYEDYVVKGQALAGEPLDAAGKAALDVLGEMVNSPSQWVEFRIERGQFQYLNNHRFAHCRTGFVDGGGERRRHLLRFWNREDGSTTLEGV